jgi:hypothetical protein
MPHKLKRCSRRVSGGAAANNNRRNRNRNRNVNNNNRNRPKKSLVFCCPTYACRLKCHRCKGKTKAGEQCKRKTCFGQYCYWHTRKKYGVRTKPTNHGKGLFAVREFASGEYICPLQGEKLKETKLEERYPGDATAVYAIAEGKTIEDAACYRGIGAHANAPDRGQQTNSVLVLRRVGRGRRFWLKATRSIKIDDEVLCPYGNDYDFDAHHKTTRRKLVRPCRKR